MVECYVCVNVPSICLRYSLDIQTNSSVGTYISLIIIKSTYPNLSLSLSSHNLKCYSEFSGQFRKRPDYCQCHPEYIRNTHSGELPRRHREGCEGSDVARHERVPFGPNSGSDISDHCWKSDRNTKHSASLNELRLCIPIWTSRNSHES